MPGAGYAQSFARCVTCKMQCRLHSNKVMQT